MGFKSGFKALNVSFIPTVETREFCCISLRRAYRIAWKCQWHRRKGSWPELRYNPGIYFESQDNDDKLVCGTFRTRSGRMRTVSRYQNYPLYSVPFIPSPSKEALSYRKPVPTGTFRDSRRALRHEKNRHPVFEHCFSDTIIAECRNQHGVSQQRSNQITVYQLPRSRKYNEPKCDKSSTSVIVRPKTWRQQPITGDIRTLKFLIDREHSPSPLYRSACVYTVTLKQDLLLQRQCSPVSIIPTALHTISRIYHKRQIS